MFQNNVGVSEQVLFKKNNIGVFSAIFTISGEITNDQRIAINSLPKCSKIVSVIASLIKF